MPELTKADMADYRVSYRGNSVGPSPIRAAYVTTDDRHPDMLAFKDHEHRTVTLVKRDDVTAVERQDPAEPAEPAPERKHQPGDRPPRY